MRKIKLKLEVYKINLFQQHLSLFYNEVFKTADAVTERAFWYTLFKDFTLKVASLYLRADPENGYIILKLNAVETHLIYDGYMNYDHTNLSLQGVDLMREILYVIDPVVKNQSYSNHLSIDTNVN
jgi:hypothetical protein